MAFDLESLLSGSFTDAVKGISDVVHSWITTKKDQQIGAQDEQELNAKITAMLDGIKQKAIEDSNAADAADQVNVSDRWKADMTSDSTLSKNVRPIILLYSWLLFTVIIVAAFFKIQLPDSYVPLIITLFTLVNGAYFGSRGYEKIMAIKNKSNGTDTN
jgi:uncharacterized protein YabN with tetrapyrrole methylase and pyrophosphatase domain